jgi:hypothetical protein
MNNKISAFLLPLLALFTAFACASIPGKTPGLMIFKGVNNSVIDGYLDKSVKTAPLIINSGADKKGAGGRIYLGYDSDSVYIYADITDPSYTATAGSFKGAEIIKGSSLVFTISTDPTADVNRASFGNYDFYFAIKASQDIESWNYTKKKPLENPILFFRRTRSGYAVEALIPWYNFNTGCFCHIKNRAISFDAAINSAGLGGRIIQSRYSGKDDFTVNPSGWGRVIFSTK